MMKRFVALMLMLAFSIVAVAQENRMFEKGYLGSVEVGAQVAVGKRVAGSAVILQMENGYRFGDGVSLSGIFGAMMDIGTNVYIPISVRAKYSILDRKISPFVSVQTGGRFQVYGDESDRCFTMGSSVGMDWSRFSVALMYEYAAGKTGVDVERLYKLNTISMLFAVHF